MQDDAADAAPAARVALAAAPAPVRAAHGWAVVGIFLLLTFAALAYARALVMPVVLAFLLTLVFTPLRRFLGRRGVPEWAVAFLVVTGLLAILLAGVMLLSGPVSGWIEDAPAIGRRLEWKVRNLVGSMEALFRAGEQIDQIAEGGAAPGQMVMREPSLTQSLAAMAPEVVAQAGFVLVLLFFLLASGDMFYEKVVHVLPTFRDKRRAITIALDVERKLSRYLSTIALINALLGLAVGLSMWALGMPQPLLFGVAAFALNFIPYLGALAGIALTITAGLLTTPGAQTALTAGLIYGLLTTFEGNFITPYFVGRRLKLNTVVVFISVALWAWLWSVVGMLVATPLLVTIRVFCEHVPQLQAFGLFLSARGDEAPVEREAAAEAKP